MKPKTTEDVKPELTSQEMIDNITKVLAKG